MNKQPVPEEFVKNFLTCPLTGKLFNTPVIDQKGTIYEQQAFITKFYHEEEVSYIVVVCLKAFISSFLDNYPEFKKCQYVLKEEEKKNHLLHTKKVQSIINGGKLSDLKHYTSFSLNHISSETIKNLLKCQDITIKKYFIDNVIDLTSLIGNGNWHFINYVCSNINSSGNEPILKYLLEKGQYMKLYCKDDGMYPLHQILHYSHYYLTPESLIIYAINKHVNEGLDLFMPDSTGKSILEKIFKKSAGCINHALSTIDINSINFKNLISKLLDVLDGNGNINDDVRTTFKNLLFEKSH